MLTDFDHAELNPDPFDERVEVFAVLVIVVGIYCGERDPIGCGASHMALSAATLDLLRCSIGPVVTRVLAIYRLQRRPRHFQ